jgi:hypothetical protein
MRSVAPMLLSLSIGCSSSSSTGAPLGAGADAGGVAIAADAGSGATGDVATDAAGGAPSQNVRVSRDGESTFEPAIAADAHGHVYVAYMHVDATSASVVLATSNDGGRSYAYPFSYGASDGFSGDVCVATNDAGDVYFAWIDYVGAWGSVPSAARLMLAQSHDAGVNWSTPQVVYAGSAGTDAQPPDVPDRPWAALDTDGTLSIEFSHGTSFQDQATGWTQALVRSSDRGGTFSPPLALQFSSLSTGMSGFASFGVSQIGGDTLVPYVVFDDATSAAARVGVLAIPDGTTSIAEQGAIPLAKGEANEAFPSVAGSPTFSCLGFLQADDQGKNHAYVARSSDGAHTFGPPEVLGTDPAEHDRTTVAADASGRCFVFWLDFAHDAHGELWSAVVSSDGSPTRVQRVNDAAMNLGSDQISEGEDYLNASAAGGQAWIVWVDRRTLPQAVYVSWLE